jgi:hypothetical protein
MANDYIDWSEERRGSCVSTQLPYISSYLVMECAILVIRANVAALRSGVAHGGVRLTERSLSVIEPFDGNLSSSQLRNELINVLKYLA